jgi:hypothetical protein
MSIRKYSYSIAILLLSVLAACDPGSQTRLDKETFEAEQRLREPRRLKEGEIFEAALGQGQRLAARLNQQRPSDAAACCPSLPAALQDSLKQLQLTVKCLSLLAPAPATASQQERDLLEAYQYSREQNLPLETNLQPLGKEAFLYTAPLSATDSSGQACGIWSIRLLRREVIKSM